MNKQTAQNKTILIAEDEPDLLQVLVDKFTLEGFNVLGAVNGEEGLRIALEKHPDLILLDLIMPVMDGLTMLKKLREDEWGKQVEVIILTNLSDAPIVAQAVEQKSFDFLVKSDWKLADVVKRVREKLGINDPSTKF